MPRLLCGEYILCQVCSEPNAGSDLSGLQMSAVIDGDDLIINGQKICTSLAQDATHIYVLVRTDKRNDYGERRYCVLGSIEDRLHSVVFTPRQGKPRIISLRKANKREVKRYEKTTQT